MGDGERNFNIFYQFIYGCDLKTLYKLGISDSISRPAIKNFKFLSYESTDESLKQDDIEKWKILKLEL